jgi:DNA-binding CsgD family transcriptional regulator
MEYGKQEKAIHLLKEAAKYYESYTGFFKNPVYPFTNALNLGVAYIYQNRDSAVFYFKSALDIAKNNLKDPQQFSANVFLGVFLQEHGQVDEAIIYLEQANRSVNKNSIVTQKIVLFESFSELYISEGDFEKAYEYLKLVSKYKDTLRLKGIEEKVIAYEYRMELDALRSNQELKLADEKLKSVSFTKRVTLIVAILTIFILVILFLLFRINKQKELNRIKAENEALEKERIKQQAELDLMKKEEQLISANFELSVRENELTNLKDRLNAHLDKSHDPQFDDLRKFLNQIKYSEKKNEQLKNIDSVLSMSSNKFHVKLKELHPNLTESELRLLTLIRLNLSNDELLLIYNISKSSLNTKRYRVRKKIGIPSTTSLEEYIMEL